MARYMVVHSTAGIKEQEEAVAGVKRMIHSLPPSTKWLNSWLALQSPKMFCEWEAPDRDSLLAALGPVTQNLPVETIYEVAHVDPRWYEE